MASLGGGCTSLVQDVWGKIFRWEQGFVTWKLFDLLPHVFLLKAIVRGNSEGEHINQALRPLWKGLRRCEGSISQLELIVLFRLIFVFRYSISASWTSLRRSLQLYTLWDLDRLDKSNIIMKFISFCLTNLLFAYSNSDVYGKCQNSEACSMLVRLDIS